MGTIALLFDSCLHLHYVMLMNSKIASASVFTTEDEENLSHGLMLSRFVFWKVVIFLAWPWPDHEDDTTTLPVVEFLPSLQLDGFLH